MEPEDIIKNLHKTPYKFTYAHKIRSEAKKLSEGEIDYLKSGLKRLMHRSENANLVKPLEAILG